MVTRTRSDAGVRDFETLLGEHRGIVFKLAHAYSWSDAEREDLVQEICLQLWRAFPRYDRERRFSTWMYRVGLNTAISHARSRRLRETRSIALSDAPSADLAVPPGPGEEGLDLRRLVHSLGELDRALLLLHLDDRSYREIGDVLGISESNVGTKLNRIKTRLRRELAPKETD